MNSKLIRVPQRTMKLDTIQMPNTVLFLDNRLPDEPMANPQQVRFALGQPSAYANRFVTRHQGKGLLIFYDYHVEAFASHEVITNGLAIFPQSKVIWTANPRMNPNID